MFKNYLNTLSFLTILPFSRKNYLRPEDFGRFPLYYPLTGLTLGLISAIFWLILDFLSCPDKVSIILLVLFLVVLTRGFHLDGLADTADALLSHKTKEEKLNIMKDCHLGTFGVLAIISDILLKTALLSEKIDSDVFLGLILLFPLWGRLTATVVAVKSQYPRKEGGLGYFMVTNSKPQDLYLALGYCLFISLFFGLTAIIISLVSALLGLLLALLWRKTLDGATGDLLGASVELGEIAALLTFIFLS